MKSTRIQGIRKNRKIYILHTREVRNVYFLADVRIFSFTYQYINQRMQVSKWGTGVGHKSHTLAQA